MSRPKSVKAPAVPAPAAVPETAPETADEETKKTRRAMGYQKQIIAGNLVPASTGKKTTLG